MHILGPGIHILNTLGRPCPSLNDIDILSSDMLNGEDIEDCLQLSVYTGNVSKLFENTLTVSVSDKDNYTYVRHCYTI